MQRNVVGVHDVACQRHECAELSCFCHCGVGRMPSGGDASHQTGVEVRQLLEGGAEHDHVTWWCCENY